jgi:hypothetical protein
MPYMTQDSVIDAFTPFYTQREAFLADCAASPECIDERISQIEEIRSMGQQVGLDHEYMALISDLLTDLQLLHQIEHEQKNSPRRRIRQPVTHTPGGRASGKETIQ